MLGKNSFLEGVVKVGTGYPRQWWNHCPWKWSKNTSVWHLQTLLSGSLGSAGVMTGLDDLRGLFLNDPVVSQTLGVALLTSRLLALILLETEACTFSPKTTRAERLCSFLTVGTEIRLFCQVCVPELEAGEDEATVHGCSAPVWSKLVWFALMGEKTIIFFFNLSGYVSLNFEIWSSISLLL